MKGLTKGNELWLYDCALYIILATAKNQMFHEALFEN